MSDLSIRRRHVSKCKIKAADTINQCGCPLYAEGRTPSGKRVRRGLRTRNLARALEMLRKWQGDPEKADQAIAGDQTIRDAALAFIGDGNRGVTETTRAMYRMRLGKFADYAESRGIGTLGGITEDLVREYLNVLPGRHGKPKQSSRKLAMVQIKTFTRYCVARKWLDSDPLAKLILKGTISDRYIAKPFTQTEVEAMLGAVQDVRQRALLVALLYTGLRLVDVAMMRWSDLDFDKGTLWIRSTEKTEEPFFVSIHPDMQSALLDWKSERGGEYVFMRTSIKGTKVSIDRTLRRLGARAGVEGVRAHRLRDTFAIRALTNGTSIRTVQHLLGHKSVTTTERHYTAWVLEHRSLADAAVARLDFIRKPGSGTP